MAQVEEVSGWEIFHNPQIPLWAGARQRCHAAAVAFGDPLYIYKPATCGPNMIRYDLKCAEGHAFEAWFPSSADYDDQVERGLVMCSHCGSTKVEKALMAPRVPAKGNQAAEPMLSAGPNAEIEKKLSELRAEVEKSSDYVGDQFAVEARAMHVGDKEHRPIYGEATKDDAKSLVEDGVPVAPLPFIPRRNS